jgi:hypothetical protein
VISTQRVDGNDLVIVRVCLMRPGPSGSYCEFVMGRVLMMLLTRRVLLKLLKFLGKPVNSGFPALHVDCYSVVITSLTSGEVVELHTNGRRRRVRARRQMKFGEHDRQ